MRDRYEWFENRFFHPGRNSRAVILNSYESRHSVGPRKTFNFNNTAWLCETNRVAENVFYCSQHEFGVANNSEGFTSQHYDGFPQLIRFELSILLCFANYGTHIEFDRSAPELIATFKTREKEQFFY